MSPAERLGAAAWLLGTGQFLLTQIVVGAAWPHPYSWARNNISDLGNVHCQPWDGRYVCSPWHPVMNASMVAYGLLTAVGLFALTRPWQRVRTARVMVLAAAAAFVLVGLAPADVDLDPHVLGALVIFGPGNLGLLLFGRPGAGVPAVPRGAALACGAVGLVGAGLFLAGHDLGLGMGGMERVAVFPMSAWTLWTAGRLFWRGGSNQD